jgi:shikimate kinase
VSGLEAMTAIFSAVDPRLRDELRAGFEAALAQRVDPLPEDRRWVLAGQRAAGKSTLLAALQPLADRPALDLDAQLERRHGRSIRSWYAQDPDGFRAAEREQWALLPQRVLVAVGGGFFSNHRELLQEAVVILVPVTFETYRERLLTDSTRPRLCPELPLDEELRRTFDSREQLHRQLPTLPLANALASLVTRGAAP